VRFLSLAGIRPVDWLIEQRRATVKAVRDRQASACEAAIRSHMSEVLRIT